MRGISSIGCGFPDFNSQPVGLCGPAGWINFNWRQHPGCQRPDQSGRGNWNHRRLDDGSGFGSIASVNDYYYNGGISYPPYASNILTHTGTYCFKTYQTYANAATRIYQDYAAGPGSQWSASVYALSHSQDYISTPCNAHLQVVFYDNAYNALAVYGSVFLDPTNYGDLESPGQSFRRWRWMPAAGSILQ